MLQPTILQLVQLGGAPILVACLKLGNVQTYENAVGALWNAGLDLTNTQSMRSSGAPGFLSQPVPEGWLLDNMALLSGSDGEGEEGDEVEQEFSSIGPESSMVGPSFFLTQNPVAAT